MNNHTGGILFSGLACFMTGLIAGIGTGFLLAPRPGVQTRRQLRHLADDVSDAASRLAENARETADKVFEQGKRLVG